MVGLRPEEPWLGGQPHGGAQLGGLREMATVRCFIVDDHPVFRAGICRALELDPRLRVVGEAGTASEARSAVRAARPHVALIDLALGEGSGLDLLAALRQESPEVHSVMLSMHPPELYAERALRAGARGFLSKDVSPEELCSAIWRVNEGGLAVDDRTRDLMLLRWTGAPAEGRPVGGLSDRELEVVRLLADGLSTAEIGDTLGISPKTVETHRVNAKKKLGAGSAAALMRAAVGLFPRGVP